MANTHQPSSLGGMQHSTHEKLHVVGLPDDHFYRLSKELVLSPAYKRRIFRYIKYRVRYATRGRSQGMLVFYGPPGTGKSDTIRMIADTTARMHRTSGKAPALLR